LFRSKDLHENKFSETRKRVQQVGLSKQCPLVDNLFYCWDTLSNKTGNISIIIPRLWVRLFGSAHYLAIVSRSANLLFYGEFAKSRQ